MGLAAWGEKHKNLLINIGLTIMILFAIYFYLITPLDGCNYQTDKIVKRVGTPFFNCYHQYTVKEIINKLIPIFGIFFIFSSYISYKVVKPRLKVRIKKLQEKRSHEQE